MSYVDSILQPDEQVKRIGQIHWIIYLPAMLLLAMCVICLYAANRPNGLPTAAAVAAIVSGMLALVALARAWFVNWTTELAITNRRVVYKVGFIWRHTVEMNMEKVETVLVQQSVLGRLLNYGTLEVKGTGQGIEQLRMVAAPVSLRNAILAK